MSKLIPIEKMKEIKQGTIFGYELVIKVPDDFPDNDLIVNGHTLEKYIKDEIAYALKNKNLCQN
jgi:hypothetical protein